MSPQGQIVSQRADRKYKEVHREEVRISDRERKRRPENKEKSKAYRQTEEWKQANLKARKRYRQTAKGKASDKRNDRKRSQTPKRKEQRREIDNRHRVKKMNLPGSHTNEEWTALCKLFDCRCVKCGNKFPLERLTRDHIIPVSMPGSTDNIENIQPLCLPCNAGKGNHYVADYRDKPIYWQQLPLL
jgi:5-methylcytosine-specific restriction endonuclease McrA